MLKIRHTESGRLQCRTSDGLAYVDVRLKPCFPLSRPTMFIVLFDVVNEKELAMVHSLGNLDAESREALEAALAQTSFVMEITGIDSIEEGLSLREWNVQTAQGSRRFLTQLDVWPRNLEGAGILIQDVSEDIYVVRNLEKLDAESREKLWSYVD